jgi:hypothetical protein
MNVLSGPSTIRRMLPSLFVAVLLQGPAPADAAAQIRGSEHSTVTQQIDGTVITIEYYRPKARGRAPLFGHDAVVWEDPWTPGANWSTSITFEKPITLNGVELEPGAYSLWMEMSEAEFLPEELILDPNPRIFHTAPPEPSDEQVRMPVALGEGDFREMLTWDFEDVRPDGATLALRWGTMRIPFEIGVEPSMRQTVTPDEVAPVLGTYEMRFFGGPTGEDSPPFTFNLRFDPETETLRGDIEGLPAGPEGDWMNALDMMLLPFADRVFAPGEVYDGVLWEVWPDTFFEFEVADGPSGSFAMRGEEDMVMARGRRIG